MAYFPLFVELEGAQCLVVGGGRVALRKVKTLRDYGARVTAAAPEILPELAALPGVTLCRRPFEPGDLEGVRLVAAATDDPALNRRVSGLCREKGIPVNVADDRANSTFLFSSLVRRGPLSVGISTGGASPSAAQYVRRTVDSVLPEGLADILESLALRRPQVLEEMAGRSEAERAKVFAALFAACMEKGGALDEAEFAAVLRQGRD